jgi:cell division protease FtsH
VALKQKPDRKPSRHVLKFDVLYLVFALAAGLAVHSALVQRSPLETISYSEFQDRLARGGVTDVVVGNSTITGKYAAKGSDGTPKSFVTIRVDPDIAKELAGRSIPFSGEPPPGVFENVLSWLLPVAALTALWMFLLRPRLSGMGGALSVVGRSRAKVYDQRGIKVTLADVAGVDEAKQELAEIIGFLKDPPRYGRLGARIPKGVLLVGPPGTGKTLLARAVAGEAGVPFLSITGSEFVEMFVGVGAARVRDLFETARKQAPAIVFIDELDALGRARGIDMPTGGHDEKEQTLNQLLAEMDGFDPSAGIIVLAATNRPEILDPALLRAGRFDRQVLVDRPDRKGREQILRVHLKKIRTAAALDVSAIASLTPGFTGADLANLVNEAALVATRRDAPDTTLEDFTQAIERLVAGLEKKSRILSARERDVVAHHETGHALVALAIPGLDPVQKVSIIPRGIGALGYTLQRPTEDRFVIGQAEMTGRIAVLLGGRAAESLAYGEVSTGAADDLARATDLARAMVVRFGMTEELGPVAYEPESAGFIGGPTPLWRPRLYGDATAAAIDCAIKKLIESAFERASRILQGNRAVLEAAAQELLSHETLTSADLKRLAAGLRSEAALSAAQPIDQPGERCRALSLRTGVNA